MVQAMTFRHVQALAEQAGLAMSRDTATLHIRLRRRNRRGGPRWAVETLQEALEVIGRQAARTEAVERGPTGGFGLRPPRRDPQPCARPPI